MLKEDGMLEFGISASNPENGAAQHVDEIQNNHAMEMVTCEDAVAVPPSSICVEAAKLYDNGDQMQPESSMKQADQMLHSNGNSFEHVYETTR